MKDEFVWQSAAYIGDKESVKNLYYWFIKEGCDKAFVTSKKWAKKSFGDEYSKKKVKLTLTIED